MEKEEVIEIAESMGFKLDLDRWDEEGEWLRFELPKRLDERGLRWIWWKTSSLKGNLKEGGMILFRAGQKELRLKLSEVTDLV